MTSQYSSESSTSIRTTGSSGGSPATAAGSAVPRRTLMRGVFAGAALGVLPVSSVLLGAGRAAAAPETYRPLYHLSVPEQWMNDPQRPLFRNGKYQLYYLYNRDYFSGGGGVEWRMATTADNVAFQHAGIAIPKNVTPNRDVWTGSTVVDGDNTAGFGAGCVVALVTEPQQSAGGAQAQFLWYSTDGGQNFARYSDSPVLPNPGVADFRDPKVIWDGARGRWVMALAEGNKVGFYISADLRNWRYVSGFFTSGIGILECPDIFRMDASDGTSHWVVAASANGKGSGLPNTLAYWTGQFDGEVFHPDSSTSTPQWLDHGWDWYAAVTYDKVSGSSVDPRTRYAIGWLNNWEYARNTPTEAADGFNGVYSIVREITLRRQSSGEYALLSRPVQTLDGRVSKTVNLGDIRVSGMHALPYQGVAYELSTEVSWESVLNAGMQLRRSGDGSRHVDTGVHNDYHYLNRGNTIQPDSSRRWLESRSPFNPAAKRVRIRALVDRTSVEVFFDDGRYVHSHEVFPKPEDTGITLYTLDGSALFSGVRIREFA